MGSQLTLRKGDKVHLNGTVVTVTGLALGSPAEIDWQKAGRPPRLRSVTVELDGPGGPDLLAMYADIAEAGQHRTTEAKWPGTCRGCGGRWEPGQVITWSEDEEAWVCGDCAARE